jgi:hypothetical protein
MKTIEPIPSWVKGQKVNATIFNMKPIGGTLFVEAAFVYSLLDENLVSVAEGNLYMNGEAYQAWGNDDEYAYSWAALPENLNLTITGNYVPPVVVPPVPEITEPNI